MKATKPNAFEKTLGYAGFVLAIPALTPIAAAMLMLQRRAQSKLAKAIGLMIVFPLFLLATIIFIPYMIALWILGAAGLVRRRLPPSITFIRSANRVDISAPPEIAERVLADIIAATRDADVNRWDDDDGLHVEIAIGGDAEPVRALLERIEREDPVVEVDYVD